MSEQVQDQAADPPAVTPAATPAPSPNPASPTPKGGNGGAAPPPQTLAETDAPEGAGATPADWPGNWRQIMAGGDEKALQRLNRFQSPVNLFKSWTASQQKIGSGELIRSRPEDPKDEKAMNEWRASVGVPEKPEGYLDKVPDGLVFGDADKPMLDAFLKNMHEQDVPPMYVHQALQWYKQTEEQNIQARADADKQHRAVSEDTLRAEWGPEYRGNLNGVRGMFETLGNKSLLERFFGARMADGTPLGDDPDTLRFLVAMDKQLNPHGTVPLPDSQAGRAMTGEMEIIRKAMSDQHSDYWKGPKDDNGMTQMQRRYRELIEIRDKQRGRAA